VIDPISMAVGAALLAVGHLTGRFRRRPVEPPPPPTCSCGGVLSLHDPETGVCHHQVQRPKKWNSAGKPTSFEFVPCGCRQYDGPERLPSFYVPPVALPPPSPSSGGPDVVESRT